MCSGVIIHTADNRQDFRNTLTIKSEFPFLNLCVFICLVCLCGFPFSSGFFSKDLILDGGVLSIFIFFLFLFSVILTFSYSLRFLYYFKVSFISVRVSAIRLNENILFIVFPIFFLASSALVFGAIWYDRRFWFSSIVFVSQG
jgi:NADH:ubiquinone oxidoreductase subunit 5 (subunit L)/multisubunit Na+/H+ antiporter MnhA subunit